MSALMLSMIIILASMPLLGAASTETDPYKFIHDRNVIYWHRSPHRYSYVENGQTKNGYIPAIYHLVYKNESLAAYCCDLETSVVEGTAYKRVNLEDAGYFSEDYAAGIRGVLSNGYRVGYTSAELENLAQKSGVTNLTAAEAMSATQLAIWSYSNNAVLSDLYYGTRNVSSEEIKDPVTVDVTEGNCTTMTVIPKTDTNINAVFNYLISQKISASESVIWTFDSDISAAAIGNDNGYDVTVKFKLSGSNDEVDLVLKAELPAANKTETVYFNRSSMPEKDESGYYSVTFEGVSESKLSDGITVNLSFSGTQQLENDVYFYEPKGGRDTAQSFVGLGDGETPIADSISAKVAVEIFVPETTAPEETTESTTQEQTTTTTQPETTTVPETTTESAETTEPEKTTESTVQEQTTAETQLESTAAPETTAKPAVGTARPRKTYTATTKAQTTTQIESAAAAETTAKTEKTTKKFETIKSKPQDDKDETTKVCETAVKTTVKTIHKKVCKPLITSSEIGSVTADTNSDSRKTESSANADSAVAASVIPNTGSDSSFITAAAIFALACAFLLVYSKKRNSK